MISPDNLGHRVRCARTWLGFAFSALLLSLSAQSLEAQIERHFIGSLDFIIEGSTSESALRGFTGLREGLDFPSAEALAAFLDEKRRDLVNDRVFTTVEVSDEAGPSVAGRIEHRITVHVVDSPTFVPLPNISYDSNLGLLLGAQLRYDNAFGTMSNWFFNGFAVVREKDGAYGPGPWELIPRVESVMLFGLSWTIEVELRREERRLMDLGSEVSAWDDHFASAAIGAKLPLGGPWYYETSPGFAGQFGSAGRRGGGPVENDYQGVNYRHALGLGRVDWIGNLRSGYDLRLEHLLQTDASPGGFGLANEVSVTGLWYRAWRFLNYYGRARVQADAGRVPVDLGTWMRGIHDDGLTGAAALFLDQTVGIDLGSPKDVVDVQLHPFLDLGTVLPPARAWDPRKDIKAGAGADFLFFPAAWRNLCIRCTFGLDLGVDRPFARPEIVLDTKTSY